MKIFLLFFLILSSLSFSYDNNFVSKLYFHIDKQNSSFENIKNKAFEKLTKQQVNYGFTQDISIWIKLELQNNSNKNINKVLEVNNPLIEELILFNEKELISKSGMLNISSNRKTINPYFELNLNANSKEIYYLKVVNKTTALQFSINFIDKNIFFKNDINKQFMIILFLGIITAFFVYALVLFFYTKDKSYLFYSLYIIILLFQQLTYVGFLPLYTSDRFTYFDNLIVVPKVGFLIIAGILFARSFLKTKIYKNIDNIYKYILYAVVFQILFLSTPWFYYPEFTVLTGLIFICFNMYTAIYVYKKGNKQARFFIVGWSFLIVGFFLSIIDALGIYSIMYHFPSLVLVLTSIEALFLLLAFVDKINILQRQKTISDKKLFKELKERNFIIEKEVDSRTKMLNDLYKELHHRVKNNLQIIISIIRLQGEKFQEEVLKEQFIKLENRIKSIAKTHEILYLNDDIEKIDMYEYIYSLCEDIEMSFDRNDIKIIIDTNVKMPLKEAVYVGIIINELVYNSMKYALTCTKIEISLYKDKKFFTLALCDNGVGYDYNLISKDSLGLKLVNNLVSSQLEGSIQINSKNKCEYNIRFKI